MCIAYRDVDAKYRSVLARPNAYRFAAQAWYCTACQFLPILLFSLFAGIIVDKFPKKNILLVTQIGFHDSCFFPGYACFDDTVKYEYIIVLALLVRS